MKSVFPSHAETAHAWAHQHNNDNFAESGRSSSGNVWYSGNSIYSYGKHFEIARILRDIPGQDTPVVLFNNYSYSSSTGQHQSHVYGAIPGDWPVFSYEPKVVGGSWTGRSRTLFDYGPNHEQKGNYREFIQYHIDRITELKDELTRVRSHRTYTGKKNRIRDHKRIIGEFVEIFRCKSVLTTVMKRAIDAPIFDSYSEFRSTAECVVRARIRNKKEEFESDKRAWIRYVTLIKELKEKLDDWRNGIIKEKMNLPSEPFLAHSKQEMVKATGYELPDIDIVPVYLRIHPNKPDIVQTTKRVDIPIKDIKLANRLYKQHAEEAMQKSSGPNDYININGRIEIAKFTSVPAVNSEGTFRFGCHNIVPSERKQIMEKINAD